MPADETALGGGLRRFPSTLWTDILGAAESPAGAAALWERLARDYWKPVYCYIRAGWRKSNEEAKDLTQAFFTHLLEKKAIASLRPEAGRFRGFLKVALRNFLTDTARRQSARMPPGAPFSVDANPQLLDALAGRSAGATPEQAFDRQWRQGVVEEAVAALQRELEAEGKSVYYRAFRAYCLEPLDPARATGAADPTYKDVADALGLSESDVRNYLSACRVRLRRHLEDRVRDTIADPSASGDELRDILAE
jgi:RNA polymerase sigma factor (sigma-70 family)